MKDSEARSAIGKANASRFELRKDVEALQSGLKTVKEHLGSAYKSNRLYVIGPDPVTDRLTDLEGKLEALMVHLGCHFEVPAKAAPYGVVQGNESRLQT